MCATGKNLLRKRRIGSLLTPLDQPVLDFIQPDAVLAAARLTSPDSALLWPWMLYSPLEHHA